MNQESQPHKSRSHIAFLLTGNAHLLLIAVVSELLHRIPLFIVPEYEYFRDELYYIAWR